MSIQRLTADFALRISSYTRGMRRAAQETRRAGRRMARSVRTITSSLRSSERATSDFRRAAIKNFKDVSRIVQGILVSKAFYGLLNAIRQSIDAVIEMGQQFEQARISFGLFLQDVPKSERLMKVLEDFAAKTPFSIKQAYDVARRLLAVGFKDRSLLTVMETIQDSAVAAGGSVDVLERITAAFSKMKAVGKITQRQLNSLALAGIPAMDILRERLQLTQKQVENIGKVNIPADIGIKALIEGMHAKYGGLSELTSQTMKGLLSTIEDNLLLLGKDLSSSAYQTAKNYLKAFADGLQSARDIFRTSGAGGLLEAIVPEQMVPQIRLLVANIKNLFAVLYESTRQVLPFVLELLKNLVLLLNVLLPAFNAAASVVLYFTNMLAQSSKGVKIFVGAVTALLVISNIIPLILAFRAALKGLLIVRVVAAAVTMLANAIRGLTVAMASNPLGAIATVIIGILLTIALNSKICQDALANLGSKFSSVFGAKPNEQLQRDTDNVKASAEEFNKELEVSEDSLKNVGDEAKKTGKKMKGALASFDEVYQLTKKASSGNGGLDDWGKMLEGTAPGLGGLDIDDLMPKFEAPNLSGGLTDFFKKIKDMFNTLCDWYVDFMMGLAKWLKETYEKFNQWYSDTMHGFATWFKDTYNGFNQWYADTMRGMAQWVIDTSIGFFNWIKNTKDGFVQWYADTLRAFTDWIKNSYNIFHNWDLRSTAQFFNWIKNSFQSFKTWVKDTVDLFTDWDNLSWSKIKEWAINTAKGFTKWATDSYAGFQKWKMDSMAGFIAWCNESYAGFLKWIDDTKKAFTGWVTNTYNGFVKWYSDTLRGIVDWARDTKKSFVDWTKETLNSFTSWFSDSLTGFTDWAVDIYDTVVGWFERMATKIGNLWNSMFNKKASVEVDAVSGAAPRVRGVRMQGHKAGGIFNKEHVARFAEGDKPEAAIPTANPSDTKAVVGAMLDAGLREALEQIVASGQHTPGTSGSERPIMQVGTLIADERGLKELYRRMEVVRLNENSRRGVAGGVL